MVSTPDDDSLSSDQDTNQFLVYGGLNPRSLVQPLETLPIELTRSRSFWYSYYCHLRRSLDKIQALCLYSLQVMPADRSYLLYILNIVL